MTEENILENGKRVVNMALDYIKLLQESIVMVNGKREKELNG